MASAASHLERTLGADFTPAVARALEKAGLNTSEEFPERLKLEELAAWIEVLRKQLYPGVPREEGLRRLGARALDGVGKSLTEQAGLAVLRVMGPERALQQAASKLGRGPLGLRVVSSSKRGAVLHVGRAFELSAFIAGLLEAFGAKLGLKDVEVETEPEDDDGATFRVSWR